MIRARAGDADAHEVADALRALGQRSPWLRPLVYVGHTLDALVGAVLVLLTTARLALVELVPAVWLAAITWDWRSRTSGKLELPEVHGPVALAVVALVLLVTLAAYWCSATVTFALLQPMPISVGRAFGAARAHAPLITSWALAVGTAHAAVSVGLSRTTVGWYGLGLGIVAVAQMYSLVALPVALAGLPRLHLPFRQRLLNTLLTAGITVVAVAPGLVLNRLSVALIDVGVPAGGVVLLAGAVILQIAATSSAHTVALATKVKVIAEREQPSDGRGDR